MSQHLRQSCRIFSRPIVLPILFLTATSGCGVGDIGSSEVQTEDSHQVNPDNSVNSGDVNCTITCIPTEEGLIAVTVECSGAPVDGPVLTQRIPDQCGDVVSANTTAEAVVNDEDFDSF